MKDENVTKCIRIGITIKNELPHDKTNNVAVRQAKTQISQSDQSLHCPHEESYGP